jgi:hypothetical protein
VALEVRIIDLDGSLTPQSTVFPESVMRFITARAWGPRVRLACSFWEFHRFRRWLNSELRNDGPAITFYGSGDFHHVTLVLLERIAERFNLLVLDKHPDWMRGIPLIHSGTWLRHALRLPHLNRVFHCGGELDFDNAWRLIAPWREIECKRIVVLPAARRFCRGRWAGISVQPLLVEDRPLVAALDEALSPFREELGSLPLYVSIDKDVLSAEDAAVNWDSGLLRLPDLITIVEEFLAAAGGRLAGADVLGDWSPVQLGHVLNRICDWIDHPSPLLDEREAAARNSRANAEILRVLRAVAGG